MKKVITYGTYDLLHYGHVKLLERAKSLGDYLIVGVTADDFDRSRGKINVKQSVIERVEAVRQTGLADEIIVEEYEGQKIDDIQRYEVDVFAIGSDWKGKFDYLEEYCKVVYLERTKGISSTKIRTQNNLIRLGLVGRTSSIRKYVLEASYVNGLEVTRVFVKDNNKFKEEFPEVDLLAIDYLDLLCHVDAVYIASHPSLHYEQVKQALVLGKHVLCEAPIVLTVQQYDELFALAKEKGVIMMDAIKTAYGMAFNRLMLLLKGGKIGRIVSIDTICTSLQDFKDGDYRDLNDKQNSICAWGPTALLPIFEILGCEYKKKTIASCFFDEEKKFDMFTKISFIYDNSVASVKIGKGIKSEGEMIISGSQGYVYVPAPWWKMDYFELRYEDTNRNHRYFYQLDGEGIRYELVSFIKSIERGKPSHYIPPSTTRTIIQIIEDFYNRKDLVEI